MKTLIILGLGCYFSFSTLKAQSKLIFTYDTAGNQIQYKYCEGSDCDENKSTVEETIAEVPLEEINTASFSVYPNPAHDRIFAKWDQNTDQKLQRVEIVDMMGKLLSGELIATNQGAELTLEILPAGIYFVRFLFDDTTVITKKILKN